ncbi:unnamed protein product [Vicia faba]|uniref:Uncharacterized protein n=1 Tax=Vicia faba TaxID=3906 RepID=A0AAV1B3J3_VICFA|nr:unnamed protein product [Vicia faba]
MVEAFVKDYLVREIKEYMILDSFYFQDHVQFGVHNLTLMHRVVQMQVVLRLFHLMVNFQIGREALDVVAWIIQPDVTTGEIHRVVHEATNAAGFMFHGKPLYVALAQKKEARQAQLQLHCSQQFVGLARPSTAIVPGGYTPFYYTTTGVISHSPPRVGIMYQPMSLKPILRQ